MVEFSQTLQQMRKNKGLTQEELAEILHVSRTAVSKWESGRGMPSIDSLKDIAAFFGVTIDDLISGEALLSLVGEENGAKMQRIYGVLLGVTDMASLLFVGLPLYPHRMEGYVYSVNLWQYIQCSSITKGAYGCIFLLLVLLGIGTLCFLRGKKQYLVEPTAKISLTLYGVLVLLFGFGREAYGVALAFLLFFVKIVGLIRYKNKGK